MLERLGSLSNRSQRIILIISCVFLYFAWFTHVPLTEIDEVRYTEATREMLTTHGSALPQEKQIWIQQISERIASTVPSGDATNIQRLIQRHYYHLIPYFNYHPRYHKPILYYWLQCIPVRMFGVHEWTARFPSALLALLMVLLVHAFLLRWLPSRFHDETVRMHTARGAAFAGAAAFATMPLIAIWARAATTDITLTFFTTCALLAMLHADLMAKSVETDQPVKTGFWYCAAACAIGLAFLTKGPVGLAIPGFVWLVYHGMQRNLAREAHRVPWIACLAIFCIIAIPWYVLTYYVDGPGFLKQFFLNENLNRYAGSAMEGHGSDNRLIAFILYFPMALITLFPYSPFLLCDIIKPCIGAGQAETILARIRRFSWVWFATVISIFAFSKTQLPSYIQSIAAAAAILFALHVLYRLSMPNADHPRWARWLEFSLIMLVGIIFVAGPIVVLAQRRVNGPLDGYLMPATPAFIVMGILLVVGISWLAGICYHAARRNDRSYLAWLTGGWSLLFLVLILGLAPLVINSEYGPSVAVGRYVGQLPSNEAVLTFCGRTSEDLTYYSRRQIELYTHGDEASSLETLEFQRIVSSRLQTSKSVVVITDNIGQRWIAGQNDVALLKKIGDVNIVRVSRRTK
ncbi:MAG TPA: glycosyltransferase family 39 protein [Armatimonadota bacterium]|nr:glycosyltransferase family 39 protein [Armatimonadota bacterium]